MLLRILILQALVLGSSFASAGICNHFWKKNPLLKIVENHNLKELGLTVQSKEGKLEIVGHVLKSKKKIKQYLESSKANDNFPFIISSQGELVISSRITKETIEKAGEIGAHSGLLNKLKESSIEKYPIAAGELRKRNNQIYLISNKSGMLRGDKKTFNFIKEYFEELEVNNFQNVELRDYSEYTYPDDHMLDKVYGRNAYIINNNEKMKNMMIEITKLYKQLQEKFPRKEKPGFIDLELLIEKDYDYIAVMDINIFSDEGFYFYSTQEDLQKVLKSLKVLLKN